MSETTKLPPVSQDFIKRIKKNEGHSAIAETHRFGKKDFSKELEGLYIFDKELKKLNKEEKRAILHYVKSIKKVSSPNSIANEDEFEKVFGLGIPKKDLRTYGVYVGHGKGKHVNDVYDDAGIPKNAEIEGVPIYGKELVVGYGHMLTGDELKDYYYNNIIEVDGKKIPARIYYNYLTEEQANKLLDKDIIKHQKEVNKKLRTLKDGTNLIKKLNEEKHRSKREALDEAMFQMGYKTFNKFGNFWDAIEIEKWKKAGLELMYGKDHKHFSALWGQTYSRAKKYMRQLGLTEDEIYTKAKKVNEHYIRRSNEKQRREFELKEMLKGSFGLLHEKNFTPYVKKSLIKEILESLQEKEKKSKQEDTLGDTQAAKDIPKVDLNDPTLLASSSMGIDTDLAGQKEILDILDYKRAQKNNKDILEDEEFEPTVPELSEDIPEVVPEETKPEIQKYLMNKDAIKNLPTDNEIEATGLPRSAFMPKKVTKITEPKKIKELEETGLPLSAFEPKVKTQTYSGFGPRLSPAQLQETPEQREQRVEEFGWQNEDNAGKAFVHGTLDGIVMGTQQLNNEKQKELARRLQDKHAVAFTAGQVAGGSAAVLAYPGSIIARAGTWASKVGIPAAAGGFEGFVRGYSESDEKGFIGRLEDAAVASAIGAGIGSAFGVAAETISAYKRAVPKAKGKAVTRKEADVNYKNLIMNNDNRDQIIVMAEEMAQKEKKFNQETLKGIQKFSKEDPKKQLKFLNIKISEAPKTIKQWVKTVNPEVLARYRSDEPLKIPASMVKIAQKNKIKPEDLHAYYNWRNNMFNYMKYINHIQQRPSQTKESILNSIDFVQKMSPKQIKKEIALFQTNIRSGLVNPASYNEFKLQEYLAEAVHKSLEVEIAVAQIGSKSGNQRLNKALTREKEKRILKDVLGERNLLGTPSNYAELSDEVNKTEMLPVLHNLYGANKKASAILTGVADDLREMTKIRSSFTGKFRSKTNEQIIEDIENGVRNPLTESITGIFGKLRKIAKDNGIDIKEYRLGQERYVPMVPKGPLEMIPNLKSKVKEIKETLSPEQIDDILLNKRKLVKGEESGIVNDLKHVQRLTENIVDRELLSLDLLETAVGELNEAKHIERMIGPTLRNLQQRHGTLPMWARETNIKKMILVDAKQITDLIYRAPVINQYTTQLNLMKMKKLENSHKYFSTLLSDILEVPRPAKVTPRKDSSYLQFELELQKIKGGKAALGAFRSFQGALYANYLGFNLNVLLRNLTQPFTMTARELGVGPKSDLLVLKSMKEVYSTNVNKLQEKYSKLGLLDIRDPRPEDFEGLKSGISNYYQNVPMARATDAAIDKWSFMAMFLYGKSDTMNRLVTAQMSANISKALKMGKTDWLKNAPSSVKVQVQKVLDKGADEDQLTTVIGQWLQGKTQLNYGKEDMYEFGRTMGPQFAMLSKWPTAVTSDISTKILKDRKKGAVRAANKYLGALAAFSLMQLGADQVIDPETAQHKAIFGSRGMSSWTPVFSPFSLYDAYIPLGGETMFEIGRDVVGASGNLMSGKFEKRDEKRLKKALGKAAEFYLPGGGIKRSYQHIKDLTGITDLENPPKKKKKKYSNEYFKRK